MLTARAKCVRRGNTDLDDAIKGAFGYVDTSLPSAEVAGFMLG
jgi:hypothetical protein